LPAGKNTQIAMERHNPFIRRERGYHSSGDCFLSNAAKPFTNPTLAQEDKHFFFNQAWEKKGAVEIQQNLIRKIFAVKKHRTNINKENQQESAVIFPFGLTFYIKMKSELKAGD
jgi:hypothetical protein